MFDVIGRHGRNALRTGASTVLISLALAGVARAQQQPPPRAEPTVHPGDGTVGARALLPYDNAWVVSDRAADGRVTETGIWTDHMRFSDVNGRRVGVRTQGYTYPDGTSLTTINTFDAVTFAPISSVLHGPSGGTVRRTFAGAHIETHRIAADGTHHDTDVDLPSAVFDFDGGMYGTLFAAQRLHLGARGVLPSVDDVADTSISQPYAVVRRERVNAGVRGDVMAWVVEVGSPVTLRFWIADRAPYVLRLVVPKTGGAEQVWNVIQ